MKDKQQKNSSKNPSKSDQIADQGYQREEKAPDHEKNGSKRKRCRLKWYEVDTKETSFGGKDSQESMQEEFDGATNGIKALMEQLILIDTAIDEVAKALRISQPPIAGKVDIRWWIMGHRRVPVFVKWEKVGKRLSPVLKQRIHWNEKPTEESKPNHGITKILVSKGQKLLIARSNLVMKLANINRSLKLITSSNPSFIEEASAARNLRHQAADNLVKNGYQVTQDVYS